MKSLRDLREALDNAPDEGAGIWRPNVGDELIGTVVARDEVVSKMDGKPQPRLVIESEEGSLFHVFGGAKMLARKILETDPQPGDRVAIRRMPGVPGKNFHVYKMVVDKSSDDDLGF